MSQITTNAAKTSIMSRTTNNAVKTSFLELPPEMRNQIYRYCLMARHTIRIRTTLSRPEKVYILSKDRSPSGTPFAPAILRVSHLLNSEAVTVLYGENTFGFHYREDIIAFFDQVSDNSKFIRLVDIDTCWLRMSDFRLTCNHLKKHAIGLKYLTIVVGTITNTIMSPISEVQYAKALGPLVRKLRGERARGGNVVHSLKWTGRHLGGEELIDEQKRYAERLCKELGAKVEELLVKTSK